MSKTPLCADCVHQQTDKGEALCTRKYVLHRTDHSTGQQHKCLTFCMPCSDERSRIAPWACGKHGRHFIAKEADNG